MGLYDVNLKKTAIGYQFDHNVYIGYQINDNRVVTFKDLQGYAASVSGGSGGGGGGGIESVALSVSGQTIYLSVNGQIQSTGTVEVTQLSADTTVPNDAVVCLVDPDDGTVYQTDTTWSTIAPQLEALSHITITTAGGTTTIGPAEGNLVVQGTATKVSHTLTLSVGSNIITYDGSAAKSLSLSTVGAVAVSTLSIATRGTSAASDDAIPTIGYIKQAGLGGNVYSTTDLTSPTHTSDENTKFVFLEVI